MHILYPYNEILPKKKAHDVFIWHECSALAESGLKVTLLCGKGSASDVLLSQHYERTLSENLHIERVPIVRKNNLFNLSWNRPFFHLTQRAIRKMKPDFIFLSVLKQGCYHLSRKIANVRYIYEVHELSYYPFHQQLTDRFHREKAMLKKADLITVTTSALKEILLSPPYSLTVPIEVVPLAVQTVALPPPPEKCDPLILMYVGQLYAGQGLPILFSALTKLQGVCLKIIGGTQPEITSMKKEAKRLGLSVEFLGFHPPSTIAARVKEAHAFVAPFENSGRMPFVAHTKLFEYASWGRPFLAPDLPIVREHFTTNQGALLFKPDNPISLANCIQKLQQRTIRGALQEKSQAHTDNFSWQKRASYYKTLFYRLLGQVAVPRISG